MAKVWKDGDGNVGFKCPGCGHQHILPTDRWGFNGDLDKPTLTPSILMKSGHFAHGGTKGNCWCDLEERLGIKADFNCAVCHSFVTDGKIQFLGDCSHHLTGQTVDLPEVEHAS